MQSLFITAFYTSPQSKTATDANISGHVIDAENGDHIPGCLVRIINTNLAAMTDASGHYIFRDLTPGYNIDETTGLYGWVEGTINGNDISIKSGQILYDNPDFGQTLYLEAVTMDEFGQFKAFLPEIHFTINDDVISQPDNSIYLSPYKDGETMDEAGFFNFMNNFSIMPIGEIPTFTPPADAKTESWVMSHATGNNLLLSLATATPYT